MNLLDVDKLEQAAKIAFEMKIPQRLEAPELPWLLQAKPLREISLKRDEK